MYVKIVGLSVVLSKQMNNLFANSKNCSISKTIKALNVSHLMRMIPYLTPPTVSQGGELRKNPSSYSN